MSLSFVIYSNSKVLWMFIYRVDKKRDKLERKVLDSQERAFWDVHRPVVSIQHPFCLPSRLSILMYVCLSVCVSWQVEIISLCVVSTHKECLSEALKCLTEALLMSTYNKYFYRERETSNVCSWMKGQWSDSSAMSSHKTLSPSGPMNYLHVLALRSWTSFWRRKGSPGMDMWNAPMVQSRQPDTYRLMERVGLGGPRWHGSSWQRGIAESGSSRLLTLMIDTPGELVWDLPCVQQASYLEGGPLMWMLPLYLHVNKKSDDGDDGENYPRIIAKYSFLTTPLY